MASAPVPLTNVGSGYTIITQVIPSSTASTTPEQNSCQTVGPLRKFLKGEPKALGTVQIMIGVLTILFGIVMAVFPRTISLSIGVVFWASLLHISAGALAVSGSNKPNACVIKSALVFNVLSTIAAGIAIIFFSLDLVNTPYPSCSYYSPYYDCSSSSIVKGLMNGISGVLLLFSLLQLIISIAVSAFSCKAVCSSEPTLSVINVIPNSETRVPVVSSAPVHQDQPGVSTMNAIDMSSVPVESPPAYSEKGYPA